MSNRPAGEEWGRVPAIEHGGSLAGWTGRVVWIVRCRVGKAGGGSRANRIARWGGGGGGRVAAAASASRWQGRMAADGDQAGGVCWPAHQRMTRLGCGGGAAPAPPAAASRLLVMPSRSRRAAAPPRSSSARAAASRLLVMPSRSRRAAAPPRSSSARSSALLRAPLGWSVAFTRTCLIVRCTFLLVRDLPRSGFCAAVVVAAAVRAAAPHLRRTRQRRRQPRARPLHQRVAHS